MKRRIVVVGGGQAALSFAARYRQHDEAASIVMLSNEGVLPYQRPPLSKAYLAGTMPIDRLLLRDVDWFASNRIEFVPDCTVQSIDRRARRVRANGGEHHYDTLFLATGAEPRRIPKNAGGTLENVFAMRAIRDADSLATVIRTAKRMVVLGGGYVGLEAAAVARGFGLEVTVLEAADRILRRVASTATSDYFRQLHAAHGVDILEAVAMKRFIGSERVEGVELADGTIRPADIAIVGIGVVPRTELAEEAGLETADGIRVDQFCRTSDPSIYAAGDCARFPHGDTLLRLESVPHAIHQAEIAADNAAGLESSYRAKPWFWSDQYDVKLQIAGLNQGYDRTVVRSGRREDSRSVWYYAGDRLLAVDAMNDAPAYMIGRRMIEAELSPDADAIADPTVALRDLMAA